MATKTSGKKRSRTATPSVVKPIPRGDRPRRLHLPAYRPLRLRRIKYPEQLPSVWKLTATVAATIWQHKKVFGGIAVIYALLSILFVHGLGDGVNIATLKDQMTLGSGAASQAATGLLVLTSLFGSSGSSSNPAAGAYELFIGINISLATIWAVRQIMSGHQISLKDAFYRGMYPLVQFILTVLVMLLQLLPLIIGASLFTVVIVNGIAATGLEQAIAGAIFAVLAISTIYMLCSSLFALYIVTLPDMTPLKALKSARQLVQYRRGQVFRKLLFLPVALLVILALIMVPVIIVVAPAAQWLFFALGICTLVVVHVYMYTLYKALLA